MAVVDPVVVPQAPKDLKDITYTPNTRVKVIISNTAEENGVVTLGPKGRALLTMVPMVTMVSYHSLT